MPHELHASIRVILPDDPQLMAGTLANVADAWAKLLGTINADEQTFALNETRAKAPRSAIVTARAPRRRTTTEAAPAADAAKAVQLFDEAVENV